MAEIGPLTSLAPYKAWRLINSGDAFGPGTAHPELPDALYIGTAGNVVAIDVNGNSATFTAVPAGTVLPIQPRTATTVPVATLALFR